MRKLLAILSIIITISPIVLLAVLYQSLPDKITGFVDVHGNPAVLINKNILSVFRLPLMGLCLQVVCFTMAFLPLDKKQDKNEVLWLMVALAAALKMSLTSMEIVYMNNTEVVQLLRNGVFILIGLAICFIATILYQLYKAYNGRINDYYLQIENKHKTIMMAAVVVYFLLAITPMFMK
jgi:hypothetical protein